MAQIQLNNDLSLSDAFDNFVFSKRTQGITETTANRYRQHFKCIAKHINPNIPITDLTKRDVQVMIVEMQDEGLRQNTIASYVRVFKAFLSWARSEGLTDISIPMYKTEETIKETYTDEELMKLLEKPDLKKCSFADYRTWVIINFILNSGARSSTIREILIKDVDLENNIVSYRHNKNHKIQVIPLCSQMIIILKEYLHYRKGEPNDYLFCNEKGDYLNAEALRSSFVKYNKRRGVKKTSVHLFRHTFAKKYLIDCGGDAFTLQRLLGHSTLDMTRHYCNIYNVDLVKNFDERSPLQNLNSNKKRITLK